MTKTISERSHELRQTLIKLDSEHRLDDMAWMAVATAAFRDAMREARQELRAKLAAGEDPVEPVAVPSGLDGPPAPASDAGGDDSDGGEEDGDTTSDRELPEDPIILLGDDEANEVRNDAYEAAAKVAETYRANRVAREIRKLIEK